MGIVRRNTEIEEWLAGAAVASSPLGAKEYCEFWAAWRTAFEPRLSNGPRPASGLDAFERLREQLPFDAVVHSTPGYALHPSSPNVHEALYAYRAESLSAVDPEFLGRLDVVVSDAALRFTCLFCHEAGAMGDTVYLDAPSPGNSANG